MEEKKKKGWIKLHRSLKDKAFIKDPEKLALWIHLLMMANHSEREEMFGGKPVKCKPGQFTTGRKQLAEATGIDESKIRRILTYFEKNEQQISQQTSNKNSLITIKNWAFYQLEEEDGQQIGQQVDNKWTTSGQQVATLEELKNRRTRRKKELTRDEPAKSDPEFNSISNMKAEQEIECQTKWAKILKVWITTESSPVLKQAYKKFSQLGTEHQQEMVQFVESVPANKRQYFKNLWVSTYLKGNLFHPGIIERDLEKYVTLAGNAKPKDHILNGKNF